MVAVVAKKVIRSALEFQRGLLDDVLNLLLSPKGEPVKDLASESPTRRYRPRLRPVDSAHSWAVMATIRVLLIVDNDSRMQKRGTEYPKQRRQFTWLEGLLVSR